MTKVLDRALTKVAELPDAEQDRIAQPVLDEIADEARWQATVTGSQDKLCGCSAARAFLRQNAVDFATT